MKIHHVALIVSDVERSIEFYQRAFGFIVISREFREERKSWKIDLKKDDVQLEMFHSRVHPSGLHTLKQRAFAIWHFP